MSKQLIFVFIAVFAAQSSWAMYCSDALFLSPQLIGLAKHAGEEASEDPVWEEFKESVEYKKLGLLRNSHQVNKLGRGGMASVFRVKDFGKNETHVIKIYDSKYILLNDLKVFDFLRKIAKEYSLPIRIPKAEKLGDKVMRMQYIEGVTIRTVKDLIADSRLPDQDTLNSAYDDFFEILKAIKNIFQRQNLFEGRYKVRITEQNEYSVRAAVSFDDETGVLHELEALLKPENIVFNPLTGELWIIDPF